MLQMDCGESMTAEGLQALIPAQGVDQESTTPENTMPHTGNMHAVMQETLPKKENATWSLPGPDKTDE